MIRTCRIRLVISSGRSLGQRPGHVERGTDCLCPNKNLTRTYPLGYRLTRICSSRSAVMIWFPSNVITCAVFVDT